MKYQKDACYSDSSFQFIHFVSSCSTITVMTSLVALSFYGASQIKFHWVERYDKILVGTVLCLVGVLTYVFHHHDGDEHSLHEHVHRKLVSL